MEVIWDPNKEKVLKKERGIDLNEIAEMILSKKYLDILEHSKRPEQIIFVMIYKGYAHLVPAILEENRMILKTCFPSRKMNKAIQRSGNEKDQTK